MHRVVLLLSFVSLAYQSLLGHRKELGNQRASNGHIPIFKNFDKPLQLNIPFLFRNSKPITPKEWNSDDYLSQAFGNEDVLVERKQENRNSKAIRMKLRRYFDGYLSNNWYVVSLLPNSMTSEVAVPDLLRYGYFMDNILEINLWIGTNQTRSVLHRDADDIIHCVVNGKKDWILIDNKNAEHLDMTNMYPSSQISGYSLIDVDSVDMIEHGVLYDVPWTHASVGEGDCLFLPSTYLHQVRSRERTISVTFLITPTTQVAATNPPLQKCCAHNEKPEFLNQVDVFWDRSPDKETIDMGYINMNLYRAKFISYLEYLPIKCFGVEYFCLLQNYILDNVGDYCRPFFVAADTNNDSCIDMTEITATKRDLWKDLARKMDVPHGPARSKNNDEVSDDPPPIILGAEQNDLIVTRNFINNNISKNLDNDRKIYLNKFLSLLPSSVPFQDQLSIFGLFDLNMDGTVDGDSEVSGLSDVRLRKIYRKLDLGRDKEEEESENRELKELESFYIKILDKCHKTLLNEVDSVLTFEMFRNITKSVTNRSSLNFKFLFDIIMPKEGALVLTMLDIKNLLADQKLNCKYLQMDLNQKKIKVTRNELLSSLFAEVIAERIR